MDFKPLSIKMANSGLVYDMISKEVKHPMLRQTREDIEREDHDLINSFIDNFSGLARARKLKNKQKKVKED